MGDNREENKSHRGSGQNNPTYMGVNGKVSSNRSLWKERLTYLELLTCNSETG